MTQASDESPVQSRSGFSPDKPIPEILAADGSPMQLPKTSHVSKDPGWIFRPKHVLFPTPFTAVALVQVPVVTLCKGRSPWHLPVHVSVESHRIVSQMR